MRKPNLVTGKKAYSNKGFQQNITRERDEGKKMDQSVAIAYGEADKAKRNGKPQNVGEAAGYC